MRQNHPLNVLKKQKRYYSGKKKRHTLKTQLLINLNDGQIISLAFANGKKHDFKLFKESSVHVLPDTLLRIFRACRAARQFQSAEKALKKYSLTKQQRWENKVISRQRIFVEHSIRFVKRFRILSDRYRNRRNRFALRFSLITGICDFDRLP